MVGVFISYRRSDVASATGRLHERLTEHYGARQVFRDIDGIPGGSDFSETIFRTIKDCAAVVVVIGPRWLDSINPATGARRLNEDGDFVRIEIQEALQQKKRVIPLLFEQAKMPGRDELPPSIASLARCQAIEVSERNYEADLQRVLDAIDNSDRPLPGWQRALAAAARAIRQVRTRPWLVAGLTLMATAALARMLMTAPVEEKTVLPPGHISRQEVAQELEDRERALVKQLAGEVAPSSDLRAELALVRFWQADPAKLARQRNVAFEKMRDFLKVAKPPGAAEASDPRSLSEARVLIQNLPLDQRSAQARRAYLDGVSAQSSLDLKQAAKLYEHALEFDGHHLESLTAAMDVQLELGQPAKVIALAKAWPGALSGSVTERSRLARAGYHNNLALAYRKTGKELWARTHFELAVSELEARNFASSPQSLSQDEARSRARILVNLAKLHMAQRDFAPARSRLNEAMHLQQTALESGDLDVTYTWDALAQVEEKGSHGDNEQAGVYFKKALERRQKILGTQDPLTAESEVNLAQWHARHLRLDEAEKLLRHAHQSLANKVPKGHPSLLAARNNLADIYRQKRLYGQAEELLSLVMSVLQEEYPSDSLMVGRASFNLGLLLMEQGRWEVAEPLLRAGWAASDKALTQADPQTLHMAKHLAECLKKLGRLQEAEALQTGSLMARTRIAVAAIGGL